MKNDVKNKPQTSDNKNDKKNKQGTAYYAQRPAGQENQSFYPQGNRYIRSWVEGTPDQRK
jgi:hypothetical protein